MEKLFENAPEIISAAAKSPLGLFALMILVLAVLGFFFFRQASERTRVTIFLLMFIGVVAFGIAIFSASSPPSGKSLVPNKEIEQLGDQELAERQAQLEQKLREMEEALKRAKAEGQQSEPTQESPTQHASIGGIWYAGGLSYVIQQLGTAVIIQEVNPIYGVTGAGQGTITGRDLNLSYYSNVFGAIGSARLRLSADERQLTGTFTNLTTGISSPTMLYR